MTLAARARLSAGTSAARRLLARTAIAVAALALAPAAAQAEPLVAVELFTSQGCSSCPPADALMAEFAARPDVLALSFNVDYWDYLGWPDRLAKPEHGLRQKAYARALGERTVYTPQAIVAGRAAVIGSREAEIEAAIAEFRDTAAIADLAIALDGDRVLVDLTPTSAVATAATVWLVGYQRAVEQPIGRGENSGRTVTYHNAVRVLTELGRWDGAAAARLSAPRDPSLDGYAVLLQASAGGPILGAAKFGVGGS